eukprot:1195394-Prorocentrum_minimum.AAC.3
MKLDKCTVFTLASGVACGIAATAYYYRRSGSFIPKCENLPLVSFGSLKDSLKYFTGAPASGRCAHWVTRCSDLKKQLTFLEEVFGMRVIRHEENSEPCGITCNGRYNNAWSKTMVGYDTEDKRYCLEVTFNYGVYSYKPGTSLLNFAMAVRNIPAAVSKAKKLGYEVSYYQPRLYADHEPGVCITGPDGYRWHLVDAFEPYFAGRKEKFLHVTQRVADLQASLKFYTETLGMADITTKYPAQQMRTGAKYGVLSYVDGIEQPALVLVEDGVKPIIESFEGRHAISMPEQTLREVYSKLQAGASELIVHELQELNEVLGVLCIFIMKDVDGMELCIVSSETFDKAVLAAADWKGPDFAQRRQFLDQRAPKDKQGLSS